jgi:hypothetical protein
VNITIPKSLDGLVRQKADDGHYGTADEPVRGCAPPQIKRARLRDATERDYGDFAAGKVVALEKTTRLTHSSRTCEAPRAHE